MNQKQRQELLAEKLKIKGSITTNEIAEEFGISKMTVGRDLKFLADRGVAELYHGGAMYKNASAFEYPMAVKSDLFVTEKKRIGKAAAARINDGSSVFLETGTTVLHAALELIDKRACHYYTNSLLVMDHFSKVDHLNLHAIPGRYRELSKGFLGMETQHYLADFYFDFCLIGAEGIDSQGRVSLLDEEDAFTKQAVMKHSKTKILVCDSSKLGKNYLYGIGSVGCFDIVLTDHPAVDHFFAGKKKLVERITTV